MNDLVLAIWPLGIALVLLATWLVARRPQIVSPLRRASDRLPVAAEPSPGPLVESAKMIAIAVAGAFVVFAIMLAIGAAWVVHHGSSIDQPIYRFTIRHQVHDGVRAMHRLTKVGDTWTCWGAAIAAAVCLAVGWRSRKWLPPVILSTVIVVDHYETLAIRHVFHRIGPPNSPHGTFPSGGCERVVFFYGLIAYLLWREFSGSRKAGIWAGGAVAALAFSEAYSRSYLTLHWFTDVVSGLLYGLLMLVAFIIAVRVVAGPPQAWRRPDRRAPAPDPLPVATGGTSG
jgi:membrane-associated phospholipid phosphatase